MARFRVFNSSGALQSIYKLSATYRTSCRVGGRGGNNLENRTLTQGSFNLEAGLLNATNGSNLNDDSGDGSDNEHNNDMNDLPVNRKPRSHSKGDYGKPPPQDQIRAVPVSEGHIMDPVATRTMTSIIRQHWPADCFTYRQAIQKTQGEFERTVLNEFSRYYKYEDGVSESQRNKDVIIHIKNRMRSLKSEEKARVLKKAALTGKSIFDQKPDYFSTDVWNSLCVHFLGNDHISKSEANKMNRSKKIMTHSTGATSHAKIKNDLTKKRKCCPSRLELFELTYKSKKTKDYSSDKARSIAERYKAILEERIQTLGEQDEEPIEWWIEAVGPVKKNRIIGEPRIPASELLSGDYDRNNDVSTMSACCHCLSDDLFFKIVKDTLHAASSNTSFKETPPSREQVDSFAEDVVNENNLGTENDSDKQKREEITNLVITTLESVYSALHHSLKGKQIIDEADASPMSVDMEDSVS